tara:strand:+ start:1732 stop:2451 length:720 start_codon:yes stop_codon:yes gene_type:complete
MSILCTICARGGSKGVLAKNSRIVAGKPLIAHTIELAVNCSLFDHVVFSSDCSILMEIASQYGASVFFKRESSLASDHAAKIPVIQDAHLRSSAYFKKPFDVHFDLDATSPLRTNEDLFKAYELFLSTDSDLTVSGMAARHSPYFDMVEENSDGWIQLVKPTEEQVVSRQNSPRCFELNASLYIWKSEALLSGQELFVPKTSLYEMSPEKSIEIDTEFDLFMVEQILLGKWDDWRTKDE